MTVIWISLLLIGHVICGPVRMGPRSGNADLRSGNADPRFRQLPRSGYWYGGVGGNSGSDGSSPLPSQLNPSYAREVPAQDAGSFSGRQDFYSTTKTDELDDGNQGDVSGPEYSQYGGSEAYAPGNYYGGEPAGSESYAAYEYDPAASADNDGRSDGEYPQRQPVETRDDDSIADAEAEADALVNHYSNAAVEAARNPELVFSDVSDLEPVYSFSSRSKYLRGRAVFSQSRYTPGEPAALPPLPMSRVLRLSVQSRPADPPAKVVQG
ncbi:uncharacterized protein LOC118109499 isoform X2 [Hippoglossus stenolepis]|uniref:uncharacterized protein LOC118109499 isoform X1 n=1 Tax=Hippoglossus stenolepis TaxID=195615 RepID=UPI001FAF5CC4|nr:uncharacterized protein LOC118109499 isoform X1 [Hippoglossus stenolepis]XP_047195876.1 uncharacterized protein LOC118109499 isoform X2 [Hippoglossus stenolepis]